MEALRDFSVDFTSRMKIRGAAELFGLKREAVRKFNESLTERPRDSTRQKIAEAYLAFHRGGLGLVRESMSGVLAPDLGELRVIFRDREDAHRKLRSLVSRDSPEAGGELPWVVAMRSHLLRAVDAAFSGGPTVYETPRTASRSPAGGDGPGAAPAPPKKRARPRPGSDAATPPPKPRQRRRGPKDEGGGER